MAKKETVKQILTKDNQKLVPLRMRLKVGDEIYVNGSPGKVVKIRGESFWWV